MSPRRSAPLVWRIAAVVPLVWTLSCGLADRIQQADMVGVAPRTEGLGAFEHVWSTRVDPPLVHEMALSPERWGFLALNNDEILRLDDRGQEVSRFKAPDNSTRIATDPNGRFPHVIVVSSTKKWTGAIDYMETTGYFLQAIDLSGRDVWKRSFDPKDLSTLEPTVTVLGASPAIFLSASRQIKRFDRDGIERWSLPLWHHPGTLTSADLDGDGRAELLAALAPKGQIVRISVDGEVLGPWASGDGPSRFRTITVEGVTHAISLRQVFGRGPGVRHALAFFDGSGTIVREVDLLPDVGPLSYSPISVMDVDGSGRSRWVIAFGDGTVLVFSLSGEELARFATGTRLRAMLTLPEREGPDLLILSTQRGLSAWRPVPARFGSAS